MMEARRPTQARRPRDSRSPPPSPTPRAERPSHSSASLDFLANVTDSFVRSHVWWGGALIGAGQTLLCLLPAAAPVLDWANARFTILPPYAPLLATAGLVERAAATVSAVAFLSFGVQLVGLIGESGLAPAVALMRRRDRSVQWATASWRERLAAFHKLPTVFWFLGPSDGALRGVCAAGLTASLTLACLGGAWSANGIGVAASCLFWLLAYVCHLSLIAVSGDFLGLQSDSNLCEVSALFALFALLSRNAAAEPKAAAASATAVVCTLRWLAARKMLGCGLCKFYGSPMWRAGTAMEVHYWVQPLPNPLSAWAHRLPRTAHRAAVLGTFTVEILLPLGTFVPLRSVRLITCAAFLALNGAINLTGSYGFIGALSVAESLSLLDDDALPSWLVAAGERDDVGSVASADGGSGILGILALSMPMLARLLAVELLFAYVLASLPPLSQAARHTVDAPLFLMQPAEWLYERARRYRLVNYYAKFASMHTFRWELHLEGSDDGATWLPYGWRYKPWSALCQPRWVLLHLPRLDWRVWFLPLGCKRQAENYEPPEWLHALLRAILRHERSVLGLLDPKANPFPDRPPRHGVRTRLVAFTFAEAAGAHTWETKPMPPKGKWDTSSLCLELRANDGSMFHA